MTTSPRIPVQYQSLEEAVSWLEQQEHKRVVVFTGPSRRGVKMLRELLGERLVAEYAGAAVHVPHTTVATAVAVIGRYQPDALITIGGGAATGLGKAVLLERPIPFIAVPTTYSGSEVTNIYGVTEDGRKRTGRDDRVIPDVIVYDQSLTEDMPPNLTVSSLLNAMAHPVGALASDSISGDDRIAGLQVVAELCDVVEQLVAAPTNAVARTRAFHAARLAGTVLSRGELGLHHRVAHLVGGRFGVHHSGLHALLLPHTVRALALSPGSLYEELVEATGRSDLPGFLFDLLRRAGCETALSGMGIDGDELNETMTILEGASPGWLGAAYHGRNPSLAFRRFDADLRCPASVAGAPLNEAKRVVVAVHGRGSTAESILATAQEIFSGVPAVTYIAPQAPHHRWFGGSYKLSPDDIGPGLPAALDTVANLVKQGASYVGFEHVFVLGFAQGACVAAEFAADFPTMLGGVFIFSGARVGPPDAYTNIAGDRAPTPMVFGLSNGDDQIDSADVEMTVQQFRDAGAPVELVRTRGDSHMISLAERLAALACMAGALQTGCGFDNVHATEALPGALPRHQNTPRPAPLGLYAEQVNGTPFGAPRRSNRRVWFYRLRPATQQSAFRPVAAERLVGNFTDAIPDPNLVGFDPMPIPEAATDFVDGLATMGGAGSAEQRRGFAVHMYTANRSMENRAFTNADGDFLLVPEIGRLLIMTEHGALNVAPGEIAVLPRGIKFSVHLLDETARGYIAEVFGRHFQLPERGPAGANGLADARHFRAPTAWFEDRLHPNYRLTHKYAGGLFEATQDYSPYDVVAWHGSYAPYVYDLMAFSPISNVRFDHPDPSIYTILSAPLDGEGTNTLDFVFFPPRWDNTEHTFRPPFFHRNAVTEINGIIAKPCTAESPFCPGSLFVTPPMTPHGVTAAAVQQGMQGDKEAIAKRYRETSMWFQFETALPFALTEWAAWCSHRREDWHDVWGVHRTYFPHPP